MYKRIKQITVGKIESVWTNYLNFSEKTLTLAFVRETTRF